MNGIQDPFSRLVVALEPWLDEIVIIGGWAHRLYRRHPAAQELDYQPLTTLDTDIATPIHDRRNREDRAKDILYMHDTLQVFGARLHELQELWRSIVGPQLRTNCKRAVSKASRFLFGNLSDDIRRAAEISDERALSPEAIREACHYGFNQVFG